MPDPDGVAKRIEEALNDRGLTQSDLGSRTGIRQSTLSSIRTGRRRGEELTLKQGRLIARVLGVSLDWLAGTWEETPGDSWPSPLQVLQGGGAGMVPC